MECQEKDYYQFDNFKNPEKYIITKNENFLKFCQK